MSEKPPTNKEIWDPWIQSWRFSNHAVFRIPEYLSSMWRDWHQQSPLLIDKTFKPEPSYFFRHPLTNKVPEPKAHEKKEREDHTPMIQFAQSALLTKMLSPNNKLMCASIQLLPTSITTQPPVALFTTNTTRYDVARDGQRFLFGEPVNPNTLDKPLIIIQNYHSKW